MIGAASIVYGAVLAVSARRPAEVLAYSSIGQAGYILVALAVGGPIGYAAAVLYALLNAVNKTLLFLAAGLRGRVVGAAFAVGAFSVAGIPPSAGFLGKAAMFRVGIEQGSAGLVALVFVGGALSFVYMLRIYQRTFWATEVRSTESNRSAQMLVLGLAGVLLVVGFWPEPLLAISRDAAAVLGRRVP